MEPFCGEGARILRSEKTSELSGHISPQLNGFGVATRALQLVRKLAFGFDRHGRIWTTMTNRPVQGCLGSLESRIGIEVHTLSGTTGRSGDPIAQR